MEPSPVTVQVRYLRNLNSYCLSPTADEHDGVLAALLLGAAGRGNTPRTATRDGLLFIGSSEFGERVHGQPVSPRETRVEETDEEMKKRKREQQGGRRKGGTQRKKDAVG